MGQIRAAQQAGMLSVRELAAACAATKLPFAFGLAIMQKESSWTVDGVHLPGGLNIYGHDPGGACYVPPPAVRYVTEENFTREFRPAVDAGGKSNGVGLFQITYRGYFPLADAAGLKLWVPADNALFGVGILARGFARQRAAGKSVRDAFWETARAYNGGSDPTKGTAYADDALAKARAWLQVVGNTDAPHITL